jgi:hypothetical protein
LTTKVNGWEVRGLEPGELVPEECCILQGFHGPTLLRWMIPELPQDWVRVLDRHLKWYRFGTREQTIWILTLYLPSRAGVIDGCCCARAKGDDAIKSRNPACTVADHELAR